MTMGGDRSAIMLLAEEIVQSSFGLFINLLQGFPFDGLLGTSLYPTHCGPNVG